jgi:gliding motility-associated-like protein
VAQIAMPDSVCVGTNRIYRVNDASIPSTYTWTINGVIQSATTHQINITWNTVGTFQLSVQEHGAGGCDGDIRSGIVYVLPTPVANAGPDTTICFGTTARLNGSGGTTYQWSPSTNLSNPGIGNPVATLPAAGTYKYILSVANGSGCSSIAGDTVAITVLPPVIIFAGKDTSIAINQPLQLNAADVNNLGLLNYTWTPSFGLNNSSIQNPVAILNRDITYKVTAQTALGCTATDDINVKIFQGPEIYVPNAFTPNGDGVNDVIRPILIGIKELRYFSVYNRYGQLVYTTARQGEGWNGMINARGQNTGAFVWNAEAIDYKGNIIRRKGTVILLR